MMKSLKLSQSKNNEPLDPNYNKICYHDKVAPVECNICGCIVVTRALQNHKKSGTCKLVKHVKDIAQLEYDGLKLTHNITT